MQDNNVAPAFNLPDQNGDYHSLKEYQGKWLVLYFYPKDETPGCTAEACAFRDGRDDLVAIGAEVVGVSQDSVASHKTFANNNHVNFTLLSDESTSTCKAYGAWGQNKSGEGVLRKTFLISPSGHIVKEYPEVSPVGHATQVRDDIVRLKAESVVN
jgi:thioredoxin-dependent peroxiredoxin